MTLGEFGYDIWDHGSIKVIELRGPITMGNPKLQAIVKKLLEDGEKMLVLDMDGVTYMDSTGVGELVAACTSARRRGATLKLSTLPQRIWHLLDMIQLLRGFESYSTQEAAVASFG
jgi:anti-sigma B factor antagonist